MYPIICESSLQAKYDNKDEVIDQDELMPLESIQNQNNESTNVVIIQFVIGQMVLEVQSYQKCIAELQIFGVRAGVTKRCEDTNISMSVHGLLLVDAIQSFGPDFELLVASHRHVGMDSVSGSLKKSEPCSPTSPISPKKILNQHMKSQHKSFDEGKNFDDFNFDETNALIIIDINLIKSENEDESLQMANITFNNLDIIANQETIVELLGLMKRIVDNNKFDSAEGDKIRYQEGFEIINKRKRSIFQRFRSEVIFDFNRLNILVLRTLKTDDSTLGRKVGTLTMSEARVHASFRRDICVDGSLGGIQIMDLTPEGANNQKIFSVGKDPVNVVHPNSGTNLLSTLTNEIYGSNDERDKNDQIDALTFTIRHNKNSTVNIKIRMASVCYTHCPRFIQEINMCIKQFKHYLKNLAKSIRNKATDMAMEFVQHIYDTSKSTTAKTDSNAECGIMSLDVVLNSPVLVLPRSSQSKDVLVVNLGKMSAYNTHEDNLNSTLPNGENNERPLKKWTKDKFFFDIRNINLFILNASQNEELLSAALPKTNMFCPSRDDSNVILFDTALQFIITKDTEKMGKKKSLEHNIFWIEGSVTQLLQVSFSREQYLQLTESIENALKINLSSDSTEILDAKLNNISHDGTALARSTNFETNFRFSVPILKVLLKNGYNSSLVNITFHELSIQLNQNDLEKELKVLLKSILMEDLKSTAQSKLRNMVDSSSDEKNLTEQKNVHCSISCPNLTRLYKKGSKLSMSVPSKLNYVPAQKNSSAGKNFKINTEKKLPLGASLVKAEVDENLVIYKSVTKNREQTNSKDLVEIRSSVDFNCLNLIISVDRWLMVLDFLGLIVLDGPKSNVYPKVENMDDEKYIDSSLKVSVRSLNLILVRNEEEFSKVNISNAFLTIEKDSSVKAVKGHLGSVSLNDLTHFGRLYREKFSTTGTEALNFIYERFNCAETEDNSLQENASLSIQMSSVSYVHTKRFVAEVVSFIKELLQIQTPVLQRIKLPDVEKNISLNPTRIGLNIHADSPIILLPSSYNSNHVIIADLGEFTLTNSFHRSDDPIVISKGTQSNDVMNDVFDVMRIDLVNTNLFAGDRTTETFRSADHAAKTSLTVGKFTILKCGRNFFKETCYLNLQVERYTNSHNAHNYPDFSVKGTLSKLHGVVNLQQYRLIREFLNFNLGEVIDDVYHRYTWNHSDQLKKSDKSLNITENTNVDPVWNITSIGFLLEDVSILISEQTVLESEIQPLACVNFIKSSLDIDIFSDGSQDIDLISSEILIVDSRKHKDTHNQNIFKYILEPTQKSASNVVQAEIHSRKKGDSLKYTILLNNMRIMAILDCLKSLQNFFREEPYVSSSITPVWQNKVLKKSFQQDEQEGNNGTLMEVVLNITNSELVFAENLQRTDTNAIILKSTTVISYKPNNNFVPISVDINHLEIFSCTLGLEDESALSIIDPFSFNLELRNNTFHILIQKQLCVRLSYNDVKLFTKMISIIPKQTKFSQQPSKKMSDFDLIAPLIAMGFSQTNCWAAMESCNYKLNDAAIWLLQQKQTNKEKPPIEVKNIVLDANCISICVIDDCMDADVPLLEFSLSCLKINHNFQDRAANDTNRNPIYLEGNMDTIVACDYYNRRLSGWEPVIEAWQCKSNWKYTQSYSAKTKTAQINVTSSELLKLNITTTLTELCDLVRRNWMKDYYVSLSSGTQHDLGGGTPNNRHRSPFVPFALQNLTGDPLLFKTSYSQPGGITKTEVNQMDMMCNWISVQPNEVMPFDFGPQTKLRHMDSHKLNLHQILVQIHGWSLIGPISIDKVGTFFRYANLDLNFKKTRIVFEISLIGSAQKLVTVRSALNVYNNLDFRLFLKMDAKNDNKCTILSVEPKEYLCVPLALIDCLIYIKPSLRNEQLCKNFNKETATSRTDINRQHKSGNSDDFGFCSQGITWKDCEKDSIQSMLSCYGSKKFVFHSLVEIKRNKSPNRDLHLPGHTITFLPPLKLRNLLCCEVMYKISNHTEGRINASNTVNIHTVNALDSFTLSLTLDNYKISGQLKIPVGHTGVVEPKLKLIDALDRELNLKVSIQSYPGKGMEINISAPIWLINKTGLPLVVRQVGSSHCASGQFEEHEKARIVSPLMFSFSDQEGSPSLEIRLGKSYGNNNTWCKSLSIHEAVMYRALKADRSKGSYAIGINVCRGRGLYSSTTCVTLSTRFQLYNKTLYKLEFAQKCDITAKEQIGKSEIISALPGCTFPFHWPNCDQEPLLCVRIKDVDFCCWSSGIPIDEVQSLYINIRNDLGEMFFLRLEVISKGPTFVLLFSNAHTLPPPIRIDNYSQVTIKFSQLGNQTQWRTNVRALSSLAYALDDPMGDPTLLVEAPGGNTILCHLNKLNVCQSFTYANFIYIALAETFKLEHTEGNESTMSSNLVLGVKDKKVILMSKCAGDRSQLWLMNSNGHLEHEGSTPPTDLNKSLRNKATRLVLDIENAPNPSKYTNLIIRPPNKQRITTQTWRFENGRLMCHANMCVQARNGANGMRAGCDAVLGKIVTYSTVDDVKTVPAMQSIEKQKLRPGSGHLEAECKMDGPIQTMEIRDIKTYPVEMLLLPDTSWNHASINNKNVIDEIKKSSLDDFSLHVELLKGLGISVVTRHPCEELAYLTLENITTDVLITPSVKSFDVKVSDIQIDNQLLETSCPVLLHTMRAVKDENPTHALELRAKILPSPNENAVIFKCLTFSLKPCVLYLEERLILKIADFLSYGRLNKNNISNEPDFITHNKEEKLSNVYKRYYFEDLIIEPSLIRVSVFTASKLSPELQEIKKTIGLTLIKFEDVLIEFDKFSDKHHFETLDVYCKAIKLHYINQIKWHAASILGSVDFLGNPLGLANDLSEGVSGLIFEGSLASLVKNVAHGFSNSTAKLTETLSDGLGKVVLDEHDNETRQKILEISSNTSSGHLSAGLKGFGFGLLGGVTSIVRHTYVGAQTDGFPGFLSGFGKGLVGTVTKPIIGVLDLASETASAVRETSKGAHRISPERKRLPRSVTGAPGGLLPSYSYSQSRGQQYLYIINHRNLIEKLMWYEPYLCNDRDAKLRLLVSTEYIRVFSRCEDDPTIMFECHLSGVLSCHPLTKNVGSSKSTGILYYIEISTNMTKITRPRVRCQNEDTAERAARCINYATRVYSEREQSIETDN